MKVITALLFALCLTTSCASRDNNKTVNNGKVVGNSNSVIKDTLRSDVLGEDRFIRVHVPSGLSSEQRCPVIYVLDGDAHFESVLQILQDISTQHEVASSMVVVGVGNIWRRYRDYTPTHDSKTPYLDQQTATTTGGGPEFISFMQKELIPHIQKNYPVSSTSIIVGHSLGGLITMEMLTNYRHMFSHYVVIDPSMWWDGQKLMTQIKNTFGNTDYTGHALFLGIANVTKNYMELGQLRHDSSRETERTRSGIVLADYLTQNPQHRLKFEYKFYKDEDHMSVVRDAAFDGIKFVLNAM